MIVIALFNKILLNFIVVLSLKIITQFSRIQLVKAMEEKGLVSFFIIQIV